jgi:5-methylcytosine-specific restriction endonuclease McrA
MSIFSWIYYYWFYKPVCYATGKTARSGEWRTVRKQFIVSNPTCAVCGGEEDINVHHIIPFHLNKKKELINSFPLIFIQKLK